MSLEDKEDLGKLFISTLIGTEVSGIQTKEIDDLSKVLVEKHLFTNSTISGKPDVEPWLRSRLLESTVAHIGLLDYVDDLLTYVGKKPEKEVKVNGYLAASHIGFSLNTVTYDVLSKLQRNKMLNLNTNQLEVLGKYLNPQRSFVVPKLDQSFDPIDVEDMRSAIQRLVWDQLSFKKESKKKVSDSTDIIPGDLILLGSISDLRIEDLLSLSKQYSGFKIIAKNGYLIWNFEGAPTMYIQEKKVFFSPSQSKAFSKTQVVEQYQSILRLIRKSGEMKALCSLCKTREAIDIGFTHDGKTIQVCEECTHSPSIWRILYSGNPREIR